MTPKISVITCTFNRPDMLLEAAASLRAQTRTDYEHLIVDAGSTDPRVVSVLVTLAGDYHVRAHTHDDNVDLPARYWNEMIDRASGDYLCFLDDDNTKFPAFLERLSVVLDQDSSVDVVTCGFVARFADGHSEENHLNLRTGEFILERNTVDTGCFLIRRSALDRIGYFPEDIRTNEDWAMVKRMHTILHVRHLLDCLATWREHAGQRMARCRELGNDADKARIRSRDWKPNLGVRRVGPDPEGGVLDTAWSSIGQVPWVREGSDAIVVLGPRPGDLVPTSITADVVVVIAEPLDEGVRGAAVSSGAWVAGPESAIQGRFPSYDRVVAWVDGPCEDWTVRMGRVLNCVRSPRYRALIP